MITILFGAGASIPFFKPTLSTDFLTREVLKLESWENVMSKYIDELHLSYWKPSASDVLEVLYHIKSIYEVRGKKINFEQLAEIIDKISSIEYDFAPDSNMLNLFLHTIAAKPLFLPHGKHMSFMFREIIANAIINMYVCNRVENYQELQNFQQKFIKKIMSIDSKVSIVSLNYDECVPRSTDSIDGIECFFDTKPDINEKELDVKNFLAADNVVYFPHGHLRLYTNSSGKVLYDSNFRMAENFRWSNIDIEYEKQIHKMLFSYDFNTFITTGQTKDNALNDTPFDIYYQRLARDFIESNTIFFIGYSFGDEHINRLFKNFLLRDETNKAYIIDKYDGEVTMVDEYKDLSNIIARLQIALGATFGIFWDSIAEKKVPYDSVLKKSNQEEIDKVNERGYGNIFNQVVFYKKGYEDFLNEYESVLTNTGNTKKDGCLPKILKCIL